MMQMARRVSVPCLRAGGVWGSALLRDLTHGCVACREMARVKGRQPVILPQSIPNRDRVPGTGSGCGRKALGQSSSVTPVPSATVVRQRLDKHCPVWEEEQGLEGMLGPVADQEERKALDFVLTTGCRDTDREGFR